VLKRSVLLKGTASAVPQVLCLQWGLQPLRYVFVCSVTSFSILRRPDTSMPPPSVDLRPAFATARSSLLAPHYFSSRSPAKSHVKPQNHQKTRNHHITNENFPFQIWRVSFSSPATIEVDQQAPSKRRGFHMVPGLPKSKGMSFILNTLGLKVWGGGTPERSIHPRFAILIGVNKC